MTIPTAGEDLKKLDYSHIAGGNVNLYSHFRKQFGSFLKKIKYDPATAVLGIYPRKMKIYVHTTTCTQKFIAALF